MLESRAKCIFFNDASQSDKLIIFKMAAESCNLDAAGGKKGSFSTLASFKPLVIPT